MESRIAVVAIIVTDYSAVERVNEVLHGYKDYVVGRLGIPYREKSVNVISVVLDAPSQEINALSGKLGMIAGVKSQVLLTK